MQAQCMRCNAPREIANEVAIVMKNGRHARKGACPNCGAKLFIIVKTPRPEG
jgi:DNA-directed RNA polymerase subunit RPC12/RpoP